jgi:hypothetical protein
LLTKSQVIIDLSLSFIFPPPRQFVNVHICTVLSFYQTQTIK